MIPVGILLGAASTPTHGIDVADPGHRVTAAPVAPVADVSDSPPATPDAATPDTATTDTATTDNGADPAKRTGRDAKTATRTAPRPAPPSVRSGAVPHTNYDAYRRAADTMAERNPRCGIDWTLLAGIGRVESHHANSGDVDARGDLRTPIYGPVLDGSLGGNQVVTDTDGGRLDGDPVYDRAVGPMQFLPATWKTFAADGNGDGEADPQNIFDAALTTARYLCHEGLDMRAAADRTAAILRYNNSMEYVGEVLGFARGY
nr:lytic murein transglycosylase [Gordonia shandongensis]